MAKAKRKQAKPRAEQPKSKDKELEVEKEEELKIISEDDDSGSDTSNSDQEAATIAVKRTSVSSSTKKNTYGTGVIYIGHLPLLFSEAHLAQFLRQFGPVVNVRVRRSPRTGNSCGFAFCRFKSQDTADIVAEALSGYLIFDSKSHTRKRLVCHVVPPDRVSQRMFEKVKRRQQRSPGRPESAEELEAVQKKLMERDAKKKKELKEKMGIDYDFPGYTACLEEDKSEVSKGESKKSPPTGKKVGQSSAHDSTKKKKKKGSPATPTMETSDVLTPTPSAIDADKPTTRDTSIDATPGTKSGGRKKKKSPVTNSKPAETTNKAKTSASTEELPTTTTPTKSKKESSTPDLKEKKGTSSEKDKAAPATVTKSKKKKKKASSLGAAETEKGFAAPKAKTPTSTSGPATDLRTPTSTEKPQKKATGQPEKDVTIEKKHDASETPTDHSKKRANSAVSADEPCASQETKSEKKKSKKKRKQKRTTM